MGRVVFVVETSEGDDFAMRRNFILEMVHFGAFSVAKEAAVTGTCPPFPRQIPLYLWVRCGPTW